MKPLGKAVLAAGLALPLAAGAAPAPTGELSITVTELRNAKGVIRACMTADPDRFPKCRGDKAAYSAVVPAGNAATLRFKSVTPGKYAIALLHDENDNGKADRALTMIPVEGFGFSRDAKVRMGPPKFRDAAFSYDGATSEQTIRMRYML